MHPIQRLCDEYNITRFELAKRTGLVNSTLTNMISRNSKIGDIKFSTVIAIAAALEIDIEELSSKLLKYEEENKK